MGNIQTYPGILFDPLNPNLDQNDIRDIAHALSMLCRGNSHFKTYYSVGQHCVNCMQGLRQGDIPVRYNRCVFCMMPAKPTCLISPGQ